MRFLLLAVSFLTVLPVNLKEPPCQGDTGRAAVWFPLIGVFIGGVSAVVWIGLHQVVSPFLAAVLAVIVWIALSGGLHMDGLADCCDGLLHASNPERRLEIMKDPRLGTFGGLGLILAVLLKVALLDGLSPGEFIWLPLAACLGRWALLSVANQPLARPGGMGADFAMGLSTRVFFAAAIPVAALSFGVGWRGLVALILTHVVVWSLSRIARARLGGVTGDVMGLTVECVELAVLWVVVI